MGLEFQRPRCFLGLLRRLSRIQVSIVYGGPKTAARSLSLGGVGRASFNLIEKGKLRFDNARARHSNPRVFGSTAASDRGQRLYHVCRGVPGLSRKGLHWYGRLFRDVKVVTRARKEPKHIGVDGRRNWSKKKSAFAHASDSFDNSSILSRFIVRMSRSFGVLGDLGTLGITALTFLVGSIRE